MQPIRIFEKIRQKRLIIAGLILFLVLSTAGGFLVNSRKSAKKASANQVTWGGGFVLNQGDETDYSNTDVTINSGTVTIDGEHTFKSIKVESGGTLTTSDYNSYGLYNKRSLNDLDKNFSQIFSSDTLYYTFIMRGYLYVGQGDRVNNFNITSGNPSEWTQAIHPAAMNPDNVGSIEFYDPVDVESTTKYTDSDWSGTSKGHAFNSTSGGYIPFSDDFTDHTNTETSKKYYPFELRIANTGGPSHFGISYCAKTDDCTNRDNNNFALVKGQDDDFNTTDAPLFEKAQIKTYRAWQGSALNPYIGNLADYTEFSNYVNAYKTDTYKDYMPDRFQVALNYDFQTDVKATIVQDTKMLTNSRTITDRLDQNRYDLWRNQLGVRQSEVAAFYTANSGWYSPLASRVINSAGLGDQAIVNSEPILSKSVILSLPTIIPAKLTILGTFAVESGGKVNLNGKGFAMTLVYGGNNNEGAGPAGATPYCAGASHSGKGGEINYQASQTSFPWMDSGPAYDTDRKVEPKLPGSGGTFVWYYYYNEFHIRPAADPEHQLGYGGGYINIAAKKIDLQAGSIVMANGVGADIAGASGGSIILSDKDPNSRYDGILTAIGAPVREGVSCGGGGGGYINIATRSDSASISSRLDTIHYFNRNSSTAVQLDPTVNDFRTNANFTNNSISVAGGDALVTDISALYSSARGIGDPGIFQITHITGDNYTITKTLEPVDRSGSATFNPYGVILGDKIRVRLHVEGLVAGTIIEDKLPITTVDGTQVGCVIENDVDVIPATSSRTVDLINWTHNSVDISKADFTYICKIK